MSNWKIKHAGVGQWEHGQVLTEDEIKTGNHDLKRLQKLRAIEATDEPPTSETSDDEARSAEHTKGDNVDPGDTVPARNKRRAEAVGPAGEEPAEPPHPPQPATRVVAAPVPLRTGPATTSK